MPEWSGFLGTHQPSPAVFASRLWTGFIDRPYARLLIREAKPWSAESITTEGTEFTEETGEDQAIAGPDEYSEIAGLRWNLGCRLHLLRDRTLAARCLSTSENAGPETRQDWVTLGTVGM